MNVILRGQALRMAPRQIAQQVRPLIGLNERQAQANIKYRERVYNKLVGNGMSEERAAARAEKAALTYAGKQHRFRAETIVFTENAYAYNRGAHMGVSQSIADGYMGRCEMVWTTAGTNRVCGRCLELKDKVVGYTDESGVTIPPLHPRCRCAIMYREVGAPRATQPKPKPQIDSLALPVASDNSSGSNKDLLVPIPRGVGLCKNFEELKFYWAENYNVIVSKDIAQLNFEAVRAAMSGVEAVLEEFPQAGFFLKEFDLYESGLMTTSRGHGKIYFNPEIFSSAEKVTSVISAGVKSMYYPKNMTAVGAGAHEAGHIVEDWLIKKFRSVHSEYRPIPRRLVNEVYPNARFTAEGKGKSLKVLMAEIAMYASKNYSECFASAVSDYITNGANASLLSRLIWQRIKEELSKMMLPGEMMLAEFSLAEQEKYGILDEDGFVIGVKDDAPVEFKAAYEHDKKQDDERWAAGID